MPALLAILTLAPLLGAAVTRLEESVQSDFMEKS